MHGGVTTSYSYDDAGNLLEVANDTIPVKTFSYNEANQITNTGFSYDANGNMTSDGDKTYIYDGDNRLIEVKAGLTTIATYTYDYMGRRTSVTESGTTTYYHYDSWNVVAETNSSGATIATYAYDDANQPISMTRGAQTYCYQTNAHGDVVSLTNESGTVVNTYSYDPWGKVLSSTEAVPNPYRYAGYRYDETTGLYYLQARYYNAGIGRFLTQDNKRGDLRNPQSLNLYTYVNNNPTNLVDPTGEDWVSIGLAGAGLLVGIGATAALIAGAPVLGVTALGWGAMSAVAWIASEGYAYYQYKEQKEISDIEYWTSALIAAPSVLPYVGIGYSLGSLAWECALTYLQSNRLDKHEEARPKKPKSNWQKAKERYAY